MQTIGDVGFNSLKEKNLHCMYMYTYSMYLCIKMQFILIVMQYKQRTTVKATDKNQAMITL